MEQAVEVAVGFALQNLLQLIDENRKLISDNDEKVSGLKKDLRLLKTFMAEYTEKHHNSKPLTDLANDIRDRVFEVEDLMETYIVEETLYRNKPGWKRFFSFGTHFSNLRTLGQTVQRLSLKVQRTNEENKDVGLHILALEELTKNNAVSEENQVEGNQEPERIIGFQDAADKVLKLIGGNKLVQSTSTMDNSTSESEQHSESMDLEVVSIHGMLGLGKTTLARKVLNDLRIEYHFFTRIFVSVSNQYNRKEVLLSMLSAFIKNIREQNKSEEELIGMVKNELKYKYLIIMDDIWENKVWEDIKTYLPNNNKGSRVLVTTRHESVANFVATKTEPYQLRFMFPHEAEELLRIKVFNENNCPDELLFYEGKILDKCNGLPLAIVVTAGILRNHPKDPRWWNDVLEGVAEVVDNNQQTKRIETLIRRSYDNLPDTLKSCFLYLGIFPEDLEIPVSKLLQLWIAEGFIPQLENVSLEKIAESCLRELVGRNLVMVRMRTLSGRIKTCIIHDTLRDFCKKMAKAENLFHQFNMDRISPSARRLSCIPSNFQGYICKEHPAENIRSFLTFGEETTLKKELCTNICKKFKLLRVLDILPVKLIRFPSQLPYLVLLKFIAICCDTEVLPKKMSSLVNLQTLIVHSTKTTLRIEANIWGMTKLRHLRTNTSTLLPDCPRQSAGGDNLQTLSTVSPGSLVNEEVLEKTKKLKKLGIRGNLGGLVKPNGESLLFDKLCELSYLENLKLRNDEATTKLPALPPPNKFPPRLTRLSLKDTGLVWQIHMSVLGKLQSLEILKLKDNAFTGEDWKTEGGGFRSLKVLYIGSTDLKSWEAKANDFPQLRCLVLKQCKKLARIPGDFISLKNLEMIELEYTKDSVVSSARRIVELKLREIIQQENKPGQHEKKTTPIKLSIYPPEEY